LRGAFLDSRLEGRLLAWNFGGLEELDRAMKVCCYPALELKSGELYSVYAPEISEREKADVNINANVFHCSTFTADAFNVFWCEKKIACLIFSS
jgi:hypothetical protein